MRNREKGDMESYKERQTFKQDVYKEWQTETKKGRDKNRARGRKKSVIEERDRGGVELQRFI